MVFFFFPAFVRPLYSTVGLFASELVTLNFPALPDNVIVVPTGCICALPASSGFCDGIGDVGAGDGAGFTEGEVVGAGDGEESLLTGKSHLVYVIGVDRFESVKVFL